MFPTGNGHLDEWGHSVPARTSNDGYHQGVNLCLQESQEIRKSLTPVMLPAQDCSCQVLGLEITDAGLVLADCEAGLYGKSQWPPWLWTNESSAFSSDWQNCILFYIHTMSMSKPRFLLLRLFSDDPVSQIFHSYLISCLLKSFILCSKGIQLIVRVLSKCYGLQSNNPHGVRRKSGSTQLISQG